MSRVLILYGRRRFAMLVMLSFLLGWAAQASGLFPGGASVIGVLVPGIIAREFDRQGFGDSLLSIAITTGILALLLMMIGYPVFRL